MPLQNMYPTFSSPSSGNSPSPYPSYSDTQSHTPTVTALLVLVYMVVHGHGHIHLLISIMVPLKSADALLSACCGLCLYLDCIVYWLLVQSLFIYHLYTVCAIVRIHRLRRCVSTKSPQRPTATTRFLRPTARTTIASSGTSTPATATTTVSSPRRRIECSTVVSGIL